MMKDPRLQNLIIFQQVNDSNHVLLIYIMNLSLAAHVPD